MAEKPISQEDLKKMLENDVKLKNENKILKETIDKLSSDKKYVEDKLKEITRREADLDPKEKALAEERAAFEEKKAEIKARELAVSSQEKAFNKIKDSLLKASEELAEKKTQLFMNAEKLASELHDKRIAAIEEEVKKRLSDAEDEAKKIIDKAKSDTDELERQITELKEQNARLSGKNTSLDAMNKELSEDKKNLSERLKNQKNEYDKNLGEQIKLVGLFTTLQDQLKACGKDVKTLSDEILAMKAREQALNLRENELNDRADELSFNKEKLDTRKLALDEKEQNIEEEIDLRYHEYIADKDREIGELKEETTSLRNSLSSQNTLITQFDDLKAQFGGKNPTEILFDYQRIQGELALALDKVQNTPSYTLQKTAADLEEEKNKLEERKKDFDEQVNENLETVKKYKMVQLENEKLREQNEALTQENTFMKEQNDRLLSTYAKPEEREKRIENIKEAVLTKLPGTMKTEKLTEIKWLNGINKKIKDYGLDFSRRILYAFHTALKNSEMSPLTVLAGVSGTGKSELPRLYSHFGGINFLSVPVQPNWDCQESMLGYYNSIDNRFEATNILRLLAQSQRELSDQTGLKDFMTMILLDEMNLANVELYFAEFLSKLEIRRGLADKDVPKLDVKIGSGMEDWKLDLGRNVLWTGTMNNDETTKTLSDKVLDRGIVISFPRPDKLCSRGNKQLGAPSPLLPRSAWKSWIGNVHQFDKDTIQDYKKTVEEINEQLGKAGRALGHRVWQSIEAYMSLYPAVIAAQSDLDRKRAMDIAFEDQLVQKVMPKLRGLETRGSQAEILKSIDGIIGNDKVTDAFHNDFKNAMEQNYGQFIWTTSTYLLQDNLPEQNDEEDLNSASGINDIPEAAPEEPVVTETVTAIDDNSFEALLHNEEPVGMRKREKRKSTTTSVVEEIFKGVEGIKEGIKKFRK